MLFGTNHDKRFKLFYHSRRHTFIFTCAKWVEKVVCKKNTVGTNSLLSTVGYPISILYSGVSLILYLHNSVLFFVTVGMAVFKKILNTVN